MPSLQGELFHVLCMYVCMYVCRGDDPMMIECICYSRLLSRMTTYNSTKIAEDILFVCMYVYVDFSICMYVCMYVCMKIGVDDLGRKTACSVRLVVTCMYVCMLMGVYVLGGRDVFSPRRVVSCMYVCMYVGATIQ
jgi:hypothetical protein